MWQVKRRYGIPVAAMLVAGAFLFGCDSASRGDAAPPMRVDVAVAETRDVPLTIEMVGSTLGNQDVPIRARVEGFLESVDFQEGRFVDRGDLLYTIDAQPFQAKLVEAQSELSAARTLLVKAEADLARIRPLADLNAVSKQQLDAAVAQADASRAGVEAAQAAVELARIELSYTRIYAPIGGLIGLTQAKPGEFVGREPNPVVLNVLSDIDPIRVRFSISEREYLVAARTFQGLQRDGLGAARDAAADQTNQETPLTLVLADGSVYPLPGFVDGSSQAIDPATGTFTLEATFANPDKLLLPGQFARVRASYRTLSQVVVIPRQAIVELQGRYRVFIVDDSNTVAVRDVTTGPIKGNDIVIETGLRAGERVVVEGVQKVRDGMVVDARPYVARPESAAMQET